MEKPAQSATYQIRQNIRRSVRGARLERYHFSFVIDYLKKSKKNILLLVSLLVIQACMEVGVLLFINGSVRDKAYTAFHQGYLTYLCIVIIAGGLAYLSVSFFALKIERRTVLTFINTLRRSWFSLMLGHSERSMTAERQADFVAKASYHFPLVSLGIDNSALGFLRWLLCVCVLLAVGSLAGKFLFIGTVLIVLCSIVAGGIAYIIANHYISQEVASYSQVIRHIDASLSEFAAIKTFGQEHAALKGLDARVENDTYFRIRRDIWLRYFTKIIYTFLFVATLTILIVGFYFPSVLLQYYIGDNIFLISAISLYSIRVFYEAGRAGLYVPPLRLGLFLSIPEKSGRNFAVKKRTEWQTLEFKSNKIKLTAEGAYFKNISLALAKGERYLFVGEPYVGKTSVAELFAKKARFNRNGWLVKMDDIRLDYRHWAGQFSGSFFISSYFHSEKTVGEIIFGKEKEDITAENLLSLYALAEKHPLLSMLVAKKRFVGETLRAFEANNAFLFAAYTLHCLAMHPSLIIIDNQWLDLGYPEINSLIELIHREVPGSTIVAFARADNAILPYNKKYEITPTRINLL